MQRSLGLTAWWTAAIVTAGLGVVALAGDAPSLGPGDDAPAFSLAGTDGKQHSLEEQRGRSNVILVFYRGVW